jgi:hypothetical protein
MRARSIQKSVQITRNVEDKQFYEKRKRVSKELDQQPGFIYEYKHDRGFGFLKDRWGEEYFFHHSAVLDDSLH